MKGVRYDYKENNNINNPFAGLYFVYLGFVCR